MTKGVIFDLDLTLVDTTNLERARNNRLWQEAYRLIPTTIMYPGIREVLNTLKSNNIKMAIVSSSPRPYIERLVSYHQIPVSYIVGYHDAHPIKPHPTLMRFKSPWKFCNTFSKHQKSSFYLITRSLAFEFFKLSPHLFQYPAYTIELLHDSCKYSFQSITFSQVIF